MLSDKLVKNKRRIKDIIIEQIELLLKKSFEEKCILFGAGIGGTSVYSFICNNIEFGEQKIKCFVDNNPLKYNTYICNKEVIPPEEIFKQYKGEAVVISCGEGDEIKEQLHMCQILL